MHQQAKPNKIISSFPHNDAYTHWSLQTRVIICLDKYRKTSNIRRTLVANKIVDHSDVVGATTSSFST